MNDDPNPIFDPIDFHDKQILEIGPGDGVFTQRYLGQAKSVYCVEPNKDLFAGLQQKWDKAGYRAQLHLLAEPIETLDLPLEQFDFAVFSHSF